MSGPVVLFAGGGTGGHLLPGVAAAERALEGVPRVQGQAAELYVGRRLKDLLQDAQKRSQEFKDEYVSSEHLLLALAGDELHNAVDPHPAHGEVTE